MPRKPKSKEARQSRDNDDFLGFVNITLSDAELLEVDSALEKWTAQETALQIDYFLEIGKFSCNVVRGSINATCTVLEGVSKGYAVSAYGGELSEAVAILRYKIQNYLEKFPEIFAQGGNTRRRG